MFLLARSVACCRFSWGLVLDSRFPFAVVLCASFFGFGGFFSEGDAPGGADCLRKRSDTGGAGLAGEVYVFRPWPFGTLAGNLSVLLSHCCEDAFRVAVFGKLFRRTLPVPCASRQGAEVPLSPGTIGIGGATQERRIRQMEMIPPENDSFRQSSFFGDQTSPVASSKGPFFSERKAP